MHAPDTKNDGERHHPKTHLSAAHSVCFKPTSVTSFFCSLFFLTHILYLVCYRGVPRSKRIVRLRESRRTGPACTEGREVKKERESSSRPVPHLSRVETLPPCTPVQKRHSTSKRKLCTLPSALLTLGTPIPHRPDLPRTWPLQTPTRPWAYNKPPAPRGLTGTLIPPRPKAHQNRGSPPNVDSKNKNAIKPKCSEACAELRVQTRRMHVLCCGGPQ